MALDQRHLFYLAQAAVGAVFLVFLARARTRDGESQFRSDGGPEKKAPAPKKASGTASLADARLKPKKENPLPLALPGIVLEGPPHEILGIPADSSDDEIRHAWRELMKRYHPDKLKHAQQSAQNSPEWRQAQKIAEAINRAKEEMLKKR
jgi:hypothetical protein